jgi:hypothetical protein
LSRMLLDEKLLNECTKLVRRDQPGKLLWHYTDPEAAIKIVESSCVHLACHGFMNDPAEGQRSPDIVTKCWQHAIDRIGDLPKFNRADLRDTSETFSGFDEYEPHTPPTFLFSMRILRDSLSQWARYGADGAGVALGFDIEPAAFQPFSPGWSYGPFLYRVLYDFGDDLGIQPIPREAAEDMAHFQTELANLFRSFLQEMRDPTDAKNALQLVAHALKPVIKQGAYHEEREWRVVAHTVIDSTQLYSMRANRFGIAPFMKLPLGSAVQLKQILLGPRLPKENRWTVEWLSRKHGIQVQVNESAFAYR